MQVSQKGRRMKHEVTLVIDTFDDSDPNLWDWNAIMEDLVWKIEVKK